MLDRRETGGTSRGPSYLFSLTSDSGRLGALGGKNWPSSIKLTSPRRDQEIRTLHARADIDALSLSLSPRRRFHGAGGARGETLMNLPRTLSTNYPFIELNPPHETVISQ